MHNGLSNQYSVKWIAMKQGQASYLKR